MTGLLYGLCHYGDPDQPHRADGVVRIWARRPRWWRRNPLLIVAAACHDHWHLAVADTVREARKNR